MMPAILFSSRSEIDENIASHNAAKELIPMGFEPDGEGKWKCGSAKLIDTKFDRALNVPTSYEGDYFIVLSPHKSEMKLQSLTAHIPGNWDAAEHGGSPRTLNISFASRQRFLLASLFEKNKKYGLGFNVNYEVDHHGPTPWGAPGSSRFPVSGSGQAPGKPIIFLEIGSSAGEWKNPLAAKIIAESVFALLDFNESCESYFGIGGGHYAPVFTKCALEKGMAFGHMLPKYRADSLAEDTFRQALERNVEQPKAIMLDKKGVNAEQRAKVENLASEFGAEIVRV